MINLFSLKNPHSLNLRHPFWLWAILWLGAFLRLFNLAQQSLWFDEAARLIIALADLPAILQNKGQDTLPPFFHLTQHIWLQLGVNDYLARFLPAVSGILILPVIYKLGRRLFNHSTGLVAAALAAIMPYYIFQSQQAGLYALLALLSALQMVFFLQTVRCPQTKYGLLFALVTILGLYTHYFTAFITLTLHLWGLIYYRRYANARRLLLLSDALIGLAFLPQVAGLLKGMGQVFGDFWLGPPSPLAPVTTLYLFIAGYALPAPLMPAALFVVVAILIIGAYDLALSIKKQTNQLEPLLILVMLTLLPILLVFAISLFKPVYLERSLIIVTPALIVLLGRMITTASRRSPLPYLFLLLGVVLLASLGYYYFDPAFAKPPQRAAAQYITRHSQPDDVIIHTSNGSFLPFLFYTPVEDNFLLEGDPAPLHPPRVYELAGGQTITPDRIKNFNRLWLVVALEHSIDYQKETVNQIDALYSMQSEETIGGIVIRQYNLK